MCIVIPYVPAQGVGVLRSAYFQVWRVRGIRIHVNMYLWREHEDQNTWMWCSDVNTYSDNTCGSRHNTTFGCRYPCSRVSEYMFTSLHHILILCVSLSLLCHSLRIFLFCILLYCSAYFQVCSESECIFTTIQNKYTLTLLKKK